MNKYYVVRYSLAGNWPNYIVKNPIFDKDGVWSGGGFATQYPQNISKIYGGKLRVVAKTAAGLWKWNEIAKVELVTSPTLIKRYERAFR